jgi:hypothetical protein
MATSEPKLSGSGGAAVTDKYTVARLDGCNAFIGISQRGSLGPTEGDVS